MRSVAGRRVDRREVVREPVDRRVLRPRAVGRGAELRRRGALADRAHHWRRRAVRGDRPQLAEGLRARRGRAVEHCLGAHVELGLSPSVKRDLAPRGALRLARERAVAQIEGRRRRDRRRGRAAARCRPRARRVWRKMRSPRTFSFGIGRSRRSCRTRSHRPAASGRSKAAARWPAATNQSRVRSSTSVAVPKPTTSETTTSAVIRPTIGPRPGGGTARSRPGPGGGPGGKGAMVSRSGSA